MILQSPSSSTGRALYLYDSIREKCKGREFDPLLGQYFFFNNANTDFRIFHYLLNRMNWKIAN